MKFNPAQGDQGDQKKKKCYISLHCEYNFQADNEAQVVNQRVLSSLTFIILYETCMILQY